MTASTRYVGAVAFGIVLLVLAALLQAQTTYTGGQPKYYDAPRAGGASPSTTPAGAGAAAKPSTSPAASMKPEELEQIVAPIALYPDSLLAQVLMASTYPLEVVQADRWVKQNPSLKNSADALNKLTWDPSVKSLIDFPQVLTMMSEKLDWTVKLGDAFIADQKSVMDAVQRLRGKAYAKGNLKSNNEQKVTVEPASATAPAGSSSSQVIVVESSQPGVVYVPTYNPTVVYGGWPYPAYPPYYYYPPGYAAGTALVSFGLGVAVGAAWGHAWGDCDWNGGDVEVDIDKNVNFNGNIDRDKYKAERDARQAERDTRQTDRQGNRDTRQADRQGGQGGRSSFQHDPSHRQGVAYRDASTTDRFRGADSSRSTAQAREAYRGRTETGRQEISRGAADAYRGNTQAPRAGGMDFRGNVSTGSRDLSGTRSSGFSGSSGSSYSGSSARVDSSRGQASRSSSNYNSGNRSSYSGSGSRSYSGGSRSSAGGARSSGGGMRGGGGGRGGGRR